MTTLLRFAWRELLRAKGRFALIALILTLQAAALGGGYLAQDSLYLTRDTWSERLHLADLDIRFVPASAAEMPSLDAIRAVPGVAGVSRRFLALGYVERSAPPQGSAQQGAARGAPANETIEAAPLPVVVHYLEPGEHPAVNDVELLTGRWLEPGQPDRALVDRSFASAHGLSIGDEIVVNPNRFASRFTVGGTGLSAEYLVPTASPEQLVPHKGSLGVIYASRESLDRMFPDVLYNDLAVSFEPGADVRTTTDAVIAAISRRGEARGEGARTLEIERVVTKTSTFGYRFIDVMLAGSRSVTPTIALIVALMATIVAFISIHRLIAERRREIGCLLAQGFSPSQLAACFFGLGLVPGLAGGALGIPAAIGFARKVTKTTAGISGFPDPIMDPLGPSGLRWLALAAGCSVLVGLLSALPPALGVLRLRPSAALRGAGEVSFVGLPAFLERLLAGSTSVRYAIRNVFRRVRLGAATAALVALAVALPSGLLTSISSFDTWARDQASRLDWDAVIAFKVPVTEAQARELMADKGIARWDGYVQGYAPVRREDGAIEEMRVRGLTANSDVVKLLLTSGRPLSSDEAEEAIVNSGFGGEHPTRLGEVLTIVRKGVSHRLVVVGMVTDATLSTVVVPRRTAARIFGLEGKMSGAYAIFGAATGPAQPAPARPAPTTKEKATNAEVLETIDMDEATASALPAGALPIARDAETARTAQATRAAFKDTKSALFEEELVTSVEVRTEFATATLAYLASFQVIIVPFVGLGGLLAFFFLVSVLGFLLVERETEYATLRSMGYGTSEIARIVLTEVGVLATVGLVLSLGTWAATAYALREPMATTWFPVPLDLRAHDFLVASLPTILFLGLAALPGIRALMRMDLSSSLRGRALG